MKGLGHAILCGETLIGDQPFAVLLADDLCDAPSKRCFSSNGRTIQKYGCSIVAIEEVPKKTNKYGVIAGNEIEPGIYMVKDMVENQNQKLHLQT